MARGQSFSEFAASAHFTDSHKCTLPAATKVKRQRKIASTNILSYYTISNVSDMQRIRIEYSHRETEAHEASAVRERVSLCTAFTLRNCACRGCSETLAVFSLRAGSATGVEKLPRVQRKWRPLRGTLPGCRDVQRRRTRGAMRQKAGGARKRGRNVALHIKKEDSLEGGVE
jgi:hypothetical protein